jgi:hypothetical protein
VTGGWCAWGLGVWQEFVDARRLPALQNAPQVLYYPRDPPVELKDDVAVKPNANVGYVTFGARQRTYACTHAHTHTSTNACAHMERAGADTGVDGGWPSAVAAQL